MKKIIVKEENRSQIDEACKAAQPRAQVRTADYELIFNTCTRVFKRVGIPKKHLEGTTFTYDFQQNFPSCYRGRPESTHFTCEYHRGQWYLLDVWRDYCPNKTSEYFYNLFLSETAKQAVLKKYE